MLFIFTPQTYTNIFSKKIFFVKVCDYLCGVNKSKNMEHLSAGTNFILGAASTFAVIAIICGIVWYKLSKQIDNEQ